MLKAGWRAAPASLVPVRQVRLWMGGKCGAGRSPAAGQDHLSHWKLRLSSARQAEAYLAGICRGGLAPLQCKASEMNLVATTVFVYALGIK